jgi:lipid-binding SYLF domain-containing protein
LAISSTLFAQKKEMERLANSTTVLSEVYKDVSPAILAQTVCMAVFPSVKKVAIGIGSSYGRGVLVCRNDSGGWGAPVMFALDQGSVGLQLGSTATDFVLAVTKRTAAERLVAGKTKLGSDAAVAAGPMGSQASSDSMQSEVLTYSRTRGVFAGVSLSGAGLEPDKGANKAIYGKEITAKEILTSAPIVPAAKPLIELLNKISPGH